MGSTTTWSDLPVEIICEVIKHLDFKSRMKLRATARFEKEVVEATKMSIHSVNVTAWFGHGPHVFVSNRNKTYYEKFGGFEGEEEKLIALTTSLMRYTKITQFKLTGNPIPRPNRRYTFSDEFLEKVTDGGGRFKFPVFNINHFDNNNFQRAFELSDPGIGILCLNEAPQLGFERVFRDPLTLPVVLGASIINLTEYYFNFVNGIMECWIKNNQTIGKKVTVWMAGYNDDKSKLEYEEDGLEDEEEWVADFKSDFAERVVEDTSKSVRIRMDNTQTHILMRILHETIVETGSTRVIALWEVIAADLTEDRYSKNSGYVNVDCS